MFPPFHGCGDRKGICLSLFLDKTGGASAPARSENFVFLLAAALGFHYFCFSLESLQLLRYPEVKDIENT